MSALMVSKIDDNIYNSAELKEDKESPNNTSNLPQEKSQFSDDVHVTVWLHSRGQCFVFNKQLMNPFSMRNI